MPAHEYDQALRAPGWFVVTIGGGIALLSVLALAKLPPAGEQIFIGLSARAPLFMLDAYTLWCSTLLGCMLALMAWAPAARRSLPPHVYYPPVVMLLLAWCALAMLFSVRVGAMLFWWLLLLAGTGGFWYRQFRPERRWQQWEPLLVLALAALFGSLGLLWLNRLAGPQDLTGLWSMLLTASPRATDTAMLFIVLGWIGPAVYLPWYAWVRRDNAMLLWLPVMLLLAGVGPCLLIRLVFFAFPTLSGATVTLPNMEHLFFLRRILGWLHAWGLLTLFVGAGWLTAGIVRRQTITPGTMRPLALVAGGLLMLGLVAGILPEHGAGIPTLCWLLLTWAGTLTIFLTVGALLPAFQPHEQTERTTLLAAWCMALATLVALPPTPGFRTLAASWANWQRVDAPRPLIVLALVLAGMAALWLLPRWAKRQVSVIHHPGAGWGIIAPFACALLLLACGALAAPMAPLFHLIRQSLLQAY